MHKFTDHAFLDRLIAAEEEKVKAEVLKYLSANYEKSALSWVPLATWAIKTVPLDDIRSERRPGGHNPDKVKAISEKIAKNGTGGMMPVVLIADKDGKYQVGDGYHRIRALESLGRKSVKAYVATGDTSTFSLTSMHNAKTNVRPSEKADQLHPQTTNIGQAPYTTQPDGSTLGYPMATVTVKPSDRKLRMRVMDTPAKRAAGWQNAPDSDDPTGGAAYDGLLFQWPGDHQATLHNRNVGWPTSATFYDSSGMYRDHFHMLPGDGTPKKAKQSHRYALEVHTRDWNALGLGPGSSISVAHDKDQSGNGSVQLVAIRTHRAGSLLPLEQGHEQVGNECRDKNPSRRVVATQQPLNEREGTVNGSR